MPATLQWGEHPPAGRLYDWGKGASVSIGETLDRLVEVAEDLAWKEINEARAKLGLDPLPEFDVVDGHEAVLIMGPPGAGKSSIANPIAYRLRAAISDVDEAKKVIPGYTIEDPDNPGKMLKGIGAGAVHVESTILGADVTEALIARGANLVIPTVGDSHLRIEALRTMLVAKGYKVHLVLMKTPPLDASVRMLGRYDKTGRLITPDYFKDVVWKPPLTFLYAKSFGKFDGYATVLSDNTSPTRVASADAGVQFLGRGEEFTRFGEIGPAGKGASAGANEQRISQQSGKPQGRPAAPVDTAAAAEGDADVKPTSFTEGEFTYALTPEFEAQAQAVLDKLRPILERLAPGTGLNVWQSITTLLNGKLNNVQGTYARGRWSRLR